MPMTEDVAYGKSVSTGKAAPAVCNSDSPKDYAATSEERRLCSHDGRAKEMCGER